MSERPTSYHVASMAGTSRAVVSAVVNGKADRYGIARVVNDNYFGALTTTTVPHGGGG